MRLHEIKELIKLIDRSSIQSFELEQEGIKLSLTKGTSSHTPPAAVEADTEAPTSETPPKQAETPPATTPPPKAVEPASDVSGEKLHKILSPMVGTFYQAPAPDAPPYVKIGDRVHEKTVVCIVEAMKLMNEIEAEVEGEIVDILVENGQLVEYGQPLFLVRLD